MHMDITPYIEGMRRDLLAAARAAGEDGEQFVAVMSGWGGAVPLWGGEVAKAVQHINQGGALWVFKLPKS